MKITYNHLITYIEDNEVKNKIVEIEGKIGTLTPALFEEIKSSINNNTIINILCIGEPYEEENENQ